MRDEIRRIALFGSGVAELTRHRAERIVRDLVKGGDVRTNDFSAAVKELLERSRQNRKEIARFVSAEIKTQMERLGVASVREVERLERRVARLEQQTRSGTPKKKTAAKTSKPKKTTATRTDRADRGSV